MKAAGTINGAHLATIYNAQKQAIGHCMDTPNNAAYAMSICPQAAYVVMPFGQDRTREELASRITGLDIAYHAQFVKIF